MNRIYPREKYSARIPIFHRRLRAGSPLQWHVYGWHGMERSPASRGKDPQLLEGKIPSFYTIMKASINSEQTVIITNKRKAQIDLVFYLSRGTMWL
jgi:hypothetical protein